MGLKSPAFYKHQGLQTKSIKKPSNKKKINLKKQWIKAIKAPQAMRKHSQTGIWLQKSPI